MRIKQYYDQHFERAKDFSAADQARARYVCAAVPPSVRSVLEVGAGSGLISRELKNHHQVAAVELSETGVAQLRAAGISADEGSIAHLPCDDRSFDLVLASEVLEHLDLPTYEAGVRELARVADKYVLVTVPNREALQAERQECPECRSIASPWTHLRSFSPQSLSEALLDFGFTCQPVQEFGPWVPDLGRVAGRMAFFHRRRRNPLRPGFLCAVCGYREQGTPFARPTLADVAANPKTGLGYGMDAIAARVSPKKRRWLLALFARSHGNQP